MAYRRIVLASLIVLAGCGPTAAVKPDPPLDDSKQIEQAAKNLQSENEVQRSIAVATLGRFGASAKPYVGDLKKLENDPDANVRALVKDAIQKIEKGE